MSGAESRFFIWAYCDGHTDKVVYTISCACWLKTEFLVRICIFKSRGLTLSGPRFFSRVRTRGGDEFHPPPFDFPKKFVGSILYMQCTYACTHTLHRVSYEKLCCLKTSLLILMLLFLQFWVKSRLRNFRNMFCKI